MRDGHRSGCGLYGSAGHRETIPPSGDCLPDEAGSWREIMGAFLAACVAAVVIAIGAAVVLDTFVQESSEAAFTRSSARI